MTVARPRAPARRHTGLKLVELLHGVGSFFFFFFLCGWALREAELLSFFFFWGGGGSNKKGSKSKERGNWGKIGAFTSRLERVCFLFFLGFGMLGWL